MKKIIAFVTIMLMSSSVWATTVSGTVNSVNVGYTPVTNGWRYYVKLEGNPVTYFLEVKDGKSQDIVDAQYVMLMTALTLGNQVTIVTDWEDYQMYPNARIRDLKIHR